jgi:DNA helicase-2/ATP-dependent DNA helicase PcrA
LPEPDEFERTVSSVLSSSAQAQLVIAAAGSGKTKLLVETLSRRIEENTIDPLRNNVVVFTFTNNAADELMVRLSSALDSIGKRALLSHIFIGTIHGWCSEFLRESGLLANTKVVDELEQAQMVQRVYSILRLEQLYNGRNRFDRIEQFLRDLEFFNNELLNLNDKVVPDNVREAIDGYQRFIRTQRLLDFGTLIREAIERFSRGGNEEKPFDVYVDEYQDVNPAQVELLKSMMRVDGSRLTAVGDPRQAIYQWRGGDVSRIISFSRDFKGGKSHDLTVNHRSHSGVVSFANAVAKDMQFLHGFRVKDMKTSQARADQATSVIGDTESFPNEDAVVHLIHELVREGVRPADIAVLMRSVLSYGQVLMEGLGAKGIPYFSPNKNAGTRFVEEFMLSIINLVGLIADNPTPVNRADADDLQLQVDDALAKISRYTKVKDTHQIHIAVRAWFEELTKDPVHPRNERYNFRQQLFNFCQNLGLKIKEEDVEIQEGFAAITQIMRAIEEAYRRRYLGGYHVRSSPLDVFTHNIRWQLENQLERWSETGMNISRANAVTVSTIHAAKGLEWPVVIVPYLWNRRFPLATTGHETSFPDSVAGRYGTTLGDERRLWYVAVTRARDRFYYFSMPDDRHSESPFTYESVLGKGGPEMVVGRYDRFRRNLSVIQHHDRPSYYNVGVTDFLLLLECPYQFFLRKVVGVDVPVGEELGAGNIVHRVIQRIAQGENPAHIDDIVREEVYLPLGEIEHERRIRGSVKSKVQRLVQSGILGSMDDVEYKFNFKVREMVVNGIVDAARMKGKALELIDWKYSVHKEFEPRYRNQLGVYAYGLRYCGTSVTRASLYDLSVKGTPEIAVDVSQKTVDSLINRAERAFGRLAGSDPFTTPSPSSCAACDVSQVCADAIIAKKVKKRGMT